MAEMRLRARPVVLLATVLLLALPAVAAADIKPIPKPADPVTAATPPPPPPATPVNKPPVNVTPPPATPPAPPATPPSPPAAPPTGNTAAIVVEDVLGGHDQSGVAAPVAPPPDPTPLALVAASEALPSHGSGTPAWKLALLALLAAGEAFLVVRLVRHRPGGELTPAQ
jgi:hypothetical protein